MYKRKTGIDILRGLSMLYIVGFWHLLEYTHAIHYQTPVTHRITWITLGIFFFISGYLIGHKKVSFTSIGLIGFYLKKLLRIYPLYLVALVWFTKLGISRPDISIKAAWGISVFTGQAPPTLWFVAMIIVFYAIAPFLVYSCRKKNIYTYLFYDGLFMLALYAYQRFTGLLELRMLVYFSVFYLGIYAGVDENIFTKKKTIFFLAVLSFLLSYFTHVNALALKVLTVVPMITICSLFVVMMIKDSKVTSNKARTIIMGLSYASYCMYLFHRPIYILANKFYFPVNQSLQVFYLVGICLPCVILFSYGVQKTYDLAVGQPAISLVSGLLKK